MSSFNYSSQSHAPSAPPLREPYTQQDSNHQPNHNIQTPPRYSSSSAAAYSSNQYMGQGHPSTQNYGSAGSYDYSSYGYSDGAGSGFPPGTHPDVIRSFTMVDRDRSGFIDEYELQQALSSGYQRFNIRTVRLLMFLFSNPSGSSRIGHAYSFDNLRASRIRCTVELSWSMANLSRKFCAYHAGVLTRVIYFAIFMQAIFDRYDRDRSGKIDPYELRDAFYSIGYAVPQSVLRVIMSKYDDGSGRGVQLNFDNFVECGMIIKGLTEKFKEKDTRGTGLATLSYETFMTMIIPFLVAD
ncbi:EF-hand domain [Dillenia turbinata]|uniref:EF-hand domain n=1 Tax=Dillenia turbinata TaxID=194707 RepID=A0AAN8V332_9MAGN